MKKEKYVVKSIHHARENFLGLKYAEIAINNCYDALLSYYNYNWDDSNVKTCLDLHQKITEKYYETIVFSTMSLESIFNDYCANIMGDEEYLGAFDSLSILNKFLFISFAIFHKTIDKSKEPSYSSLKKLVKQRNELVHNKSKKFVLEESDFQHLIDLTDEEFENERKNDLKEKCKLMISYIKDAVRAMYYVLQYLDKYDEGINMAPCLFYKIEKDKSLMNDEEKKMNYLIDKLKIK